jgi:ATP-binding cassette subfamily F protein uup
VPGWAGRTALELQDATLAVGERALLDHCTWNIGPGDRIGIVRARWDLGKTSRGACCSASTRRPWECWSTGSTVQSAYLSQHLQVDPRWRVLEAVEDVAGRVDLGKGLGSLSASQLCERLGFGPDRQWTPAGDVRASDAAWNSSGLRDGRAHRAGPG